MPRFVSCVILQVAGQREGTPALAEDERGEEGAGEAAAAPNGAAEAAGPADAATPAAASEGEGQPSSLASMLERRVEEEQVETPEASGWYCRYLYCWHWVLPPLATVGAGAWYWVGLLCLIPCYSGA